LRAATAANMRNKYNLRTAFFNLGGLVPFLLFCGGGFVGFATTLPKAAPLTTTAPRPTPQPRPRPTPPPHPNAESVHEVWVARYGGPESGEDQAFAITLDTLGNVYVTGRSYVSPGPGINYDCVTVKYDSTGQQQWIARYNGPGNGDDEGRAIAVDASGNVYVTGASINASLEYDYVTIKYNSAGQEQWVVRYDAHGTYGDYAVGIALDASGNVYVTGTSDDGDGISDYATIKYDPAGQQQWVVRYSGPANGGGGATAMALDTSGNIYVTGTTSNGNDSDYATIKYNSAGQQQWVALYDGPAGGEIAHAIALDGSGNVYVTGASQGVGTDLDYATVKYNSAGQEQWARRYVGPSDHDEALSVAIDKQGNVFVTGFSYSSGTSYDYATVKYNSAGQEQWVARYNGPANDTDYGNAIAVDDSGNAYVTGTSIGTVGYYDYATIKYSPNGQRQWVARYNGPGSDSDEANAIVLDSSGNVYVTGFSSESGFDFDYATIKYVQGSTSPINPIPRH